MNEQHLEETGTVKKSFCYKDGRFYFTKEAERSFYFVLTLMMLVAGILYKTGIL